MKNCSDELIDALAAYGISAERKSLYNDIENLRVYGLDVTCRIKAIGGFRSGS